MRPRPRHARSDCGLVLITVTVFVLILGGIAYGFLLLNAGERTSIGNSEGKSKALGIVEMALLKAELEIRSDIDHDGGGVGNVAGAAAGGTYEVAATRVSTHPNLWTVTAVGRHGLNVRRVELSLHVLSGPFAYALFGKDWIKLEGGSQTDSFDSDLGDYASQAVNGGGTFDGEYALTNGHVGSNGDITVWAGTVVRGNGVPGPTGSIHGSLDKIWGDTTPRTIEADLPPPPYADFVAALAANDNDNIDPSLGGVNYDAGRYDLALSAGVDLVLPPGTYFFTDVSMKGNSTIQVTGPTKIYVIGDMSLGGGSLSNATGMASNLLVFAHPYSMVPGFTPPATPQLRVRGGAGTALALYAPAADVDAGGGGDVWGSIVGNTISLQGGTLFHYDERLASLRFGDDAPIERVAWVDLQAPGR